MSIVPIPPRQAPDQTGSITRRDIVTRTAKLTGGAALVLLSVQHSLQTVAAQDIIVRRTGAAAEVSAGPGIASALSAAAEAAAERGAARVEAAVALASADSENGARAQSSMALAAADPDQGAIAQSAVAVTSASSEDDVATPRAQRLVAAPAGGRGGGGRMRGAMRRGGRVRAGAVGGGRRIRERAGRGGGRERRRDRVGELPATGAGDATPRALSSLLAAASALAAIGAVAMRDRSEPALATAPDVKL